MVPRGAAGDPARLTLVAALGVGAVAVAFETGIPGSGVFLVAAWLAGVATVWLRPGWGGFLTLAIAIAVAAVIADMSDGVSGLVVLVVASLIVPAAHGALVGYIVRRMILIGPANAIRDGWVLGALVVAVLGVMLVALAAAEFARNPP